MQLLTGVSWRGHSGRVYCAAREKLETFVLSDGDLYLLARGASALWVGTARDLIDDQVSRAGFRAALRTAESVYRLAAPADPVERMTMVCDLEAGTMDFTRSAA